LDFKEERSGKEDKGKGFECPGKGQGGVGDVWSAEPVDSEYFWNCAKRSRPTQRKWAPPTILSTRLNSQKIDQYSKMA